MASTNLLFGRSLNCWDNLDSSNDSSSIPSIIPSLQITNSASAIENIQKIAYQIFAPLTITAGIIGNILNLIVLTTRPFIKGGTRVYLTALAISDLSVMITVIPMIVRWNGSHGSSFLAAFYHAHIELFLSNTFIASSIFIVVCLTVDRYFSICLPMMFRSIQRKRIARYAVFISYIAAIVVSTPLMVLKNICQVVNTTEDCTHWDFHENNDITSTIYWSIYIWFSECVIRFGPCVVLSVLNVLIIQKFRQITAKRRIFRDALTKSNHHQFYGCVSDSKLRKALRNRKYQEEKRLIALLRAIVVLFFITMTPSAILSLLYNEKQEGQFAFQIFRAAANNLELLNFSMNFCIYFLYSREFRNTLNDIFTGCTQCNEEFSDTDAYEGDSDGIKSLFKVMNKSGLSSDYKNSEDADRSIASNKIVQN